MDRGPPQLDELSESLLSRTPLHLACYSGDTDLVDSVLANILVCNKRDQAESCLDVLISEEDGVNGWTPAHWAARYGHLNCLKKLNVRPNLGFDTPCQRSNTSPLHLATQSGSLLCLKWLLQRGSSTNRQDFMGDTALHKAVRSGNLDCAMMLVNHGASLELKNHRSLIPAELAEQMGHRALVNCLRPKESREQSMPTSPHHSSLHSMLPPHENVLMNQATKQPSPLNLVETRHCLSEHSLSPEEESSQGSSIMMNGVDVYNKISVTSDSNYNSVSADSCDMDTTCYDQILTDDKDSVLSNLSWSKKRSIDGFHSDDVHSTKRKCFVPISQKNTEARHGNACNNNIISSYNAVLAMRVDYKSNSDNLESANKTCGATLRQSSDMEHEESDVAQHYDNSYVNTFSCVFH